MKKLLSALKKDPMLIFIKWLIVILLALTVVNLLIKPLKKSLSQQYFERGNNLLIQKKYVSAQIEYQKALVLFGQNGQAASRLKLAKEASTDILKLEPLLQESNITMKTTLFAKAKSIPRTETEGVGIARELIEQEEYQLAIVAAKTALEMDDDYRDAWLYLGIANLETAENVELAKADRQFFFEQAREALERALEIDPGYRPAVSYLEELKRL